MNVNKIKLIAADVDNTMAPTREVLSPYAIDIIKRVRAKGIKFAVASGRPLFQIRVALDQWKYDDFDYLIGLNGGSVYDYSTNESEEYASLTPKQIKESMDLFKDFDGEWSTYEGDATLFYKASEMMMEFAKAGFGNVLSTDSLEEFQGKNRSKLMFRVDEEVMPKLEEMLKGKTFDGYSCFKTQKMLMEVCPNESHKAAGVKIVAEKMGIKKDEIIAFGDTTNDNTMIEYAGVGVCLLNGSDDTKALADYITDKECKDDGMWHFIEDYILNKLA